MGIALGAVMQVAIIGYGAVGRETAKALAARGASVRIVQRRSPNFLPEGVTFFAADALDRDSLRRACADSGVVICCLGFAYDSRIWRVAWPQAMDNLLAVCAEKRARFVFADNLYMYGPQDEPLDEGMPLTDFGRKPKIRAEITRAWVEAHGSGRVEAAAVRASDFYGPDVENSVLSTFAVQRLAQGKAALIPYSPDHLHDFTYVPDFARALLALVEAPGDAYGHAWHAPNAPAQTPRVHIERAAALLGVKPRVSVLPKPALHLLGLFDRQVYELIEMRFQTDRPYLVNSTRFASRFWSDPTPFDEGLKATVDFYKAAGKRA
jgi:nucleoside-diphosphate-sugar epimerase